MDNLKPCPFCGSTDLYVVQAKIEEYHSVEPEISCKKCRYTIKLKELAIAIDESPKTNADWWDRGTAKKWNTRPAEDALTEKMELFRQTLAEVAKMAIDSEQEQIYKKCRDVLRDVYLEEVFKEKFDKILHGNDTNALTKESEGEDE